MKGLIKCVLMLCLFVSGALSYASSETRTNYETGTPILTIVKSQYGGTDKGNTVSASLDGHYLTIVIGENVGQTQIDISSMSGITVDSSTISTPSVYQVYIPLEDNYFFIITLANGDEYYGEFTVTD